MDRTGHDEEGSSALQIQLLELAKNPLGVVRRRWPGMSLALLLGLLATGGLVATLEPSFQATATVLVSSQQIPEDFVRSTVRGFDSLSNVNALVGEVLSQRNLSGLLDEHSLYPKSGKGVPRNDLVDRFRSNISIEQQRNVNQQRPRESTAIYVISYAGETPESAAEVSNALASILITANLEKRSEQARRTTEFLRRELGRVEAKLASANSEITEFSQKYRGELPGDLQPLLQKLERLQAQRQNLNEQISAASDRLVNLETAETTSSAEQQLLQMRLQLDQESAIHTEEHPNVIALRRRIERMEATLGQRSNGETSRFSTRGIQITDARRQLEALREKLALTEQQLAEIDTRVDRIPGRSEDLAALQQRASVLRESHLEFMRKVKDAELAETLESAQQGPQVSLLDPAHIPTGPVRPPGLFLLPGLLGAFVLAAAIGIGLEVLDPVLLSAGHFGSLGSAPVLGSVYRQS